MLTVAVLGPVELHRDGERLAVPAGKTTEVLIRLALDAGTLVRTERLIEDLWSKQAVGVARNTLQAKVSKLRRVLGDPGLVSGDSAGYTLHVDPGGVDALEVLRIADTVAGLHDAEAVRRATGAALAMFRGEILPLDWLLPHRARLEEAWLRLTEDHLEARLALGAGAELIGKLESLVSAHPLREGLWRLLITALYRSGRQADALAAYGRVRTVLADELGLDPGPELRALERQILRQDAVLDAPVRGNLPGLSASLIGRDADLDAVGRLLRARRLVTIVGPAGVGKTRLAIEAARAVSGAWLVRVDSAHNAATAWQGIGEAFAMSEATEAMVLDRLRGLDGLLVLDNCEHLVEVLPAVVGRILGRGPRILATSQLPLGVDGESTYPLEPLSVGDSVALFTERAAHQRRSFRADAATVETVCRALDGLPLAIELAAARAKALSIEEIARRLGDRFTLLNDPTSRGPERRRTLRGAIAWSYDLLFPDDQRGLWALACFTGGAPLAAAEDVLTALGVPHASAVDVIGRLVDRSLAAVDVGAGGAVRYRLLDSVREFALERLRESGQIDIAFGAYAAWFAAAAAQAASGLRGHEQPHHLALVRTERPNIDAALAWAAGHEPLLGLRMANGFGWAWVFLGAGSDAAQRFRTALAAVSPAAAPPAAPSSPASPPALAPSAAAPPAAPSSPSSPPAVAPSAAAAPLADRVDAMLFAGWFEASGGDLDRAVGEVRSTVELAEDKARARLFLAFVHSQRGRPHDALAALAACRDLLSGWERGAAWLLTAWAEIALGEVARGKQACGEALRLLVPLGDQWALSHAEAMLGALAQAEYRFPDAVAHLGRAADAADRLGFLAAGSLHRTNLGRAYQQNGEPAAAVAAFERAIETAHTAGDLAAARRDRDPEIEVLTLDALALLHASEGRTREARSLRAEADRLMPAARHLMTDAERSVLP